MTQSEGFGARLVGLSVLIQRRYAQICADHDLTPAQAQLLCMIKDEPLGMSQLAKIMGLAKNGLSGLVDRAEKRGLVHRETPDHDRRAVTLSVTPLGQETVDALFADVNKHLPDILDKLSVEDRRTADQMLIAIATAAGAPLLFGGAGASPTTPCTAC
nr:MarR family transcriptional regulator [Dactylosporangium thailandense]